MAMHPDAVRAYKKLREAFDEVSRLEVVFEPYVKGLTDKNDLADAAYAARELETMADAIRKRAKANKELAERICCMICALTSDVDPIKTEFVTASPGIRTVASLPHRSTDRENYALLMDYLGIDRKHWEGVEHACVQPHWPGVMEDINTLLAAGEPLPPGVDPSKTYAEYSLRMRGVKGPA